MIRKQSTLSTGYWFIRWIELSALWTTGAWYLLINFWKYSHWSSTEPRTTGSGVKRDVHSATLLMSTNLVLILILIQLFIDCSSIDINTRVFFPRKMCGDRRKNHGCGQKKPECTSSVIFGVGTAAKCCKLKWCAHRIRSRTQQRRSPRRQIS